MSAVSRRNSMSDVKLSKRSKSLLEDEEVEELPIKQEKVEPILTSTKKGNKRRSLDSLAVDRAKSTKTEESWLNSPKNKTEVARKVTPKSDGKSDSTTLKRGILLCSTD